jgi:hypothetical protein
MTEQEIKALAGIIEMLLINRQEGLQLNPKECESLAAILRCLLGHGV